LVSNQCGGYNFWETMQLQMIASIDHPLPDGYRQSQHVLAGLLNSVVKKPQTNPIKLAKKMATWPTVKTIEYTQKLVNYLTKRDRVPAMKHQDILRALIMLNSEKMELNNAANAWLHGTETDEALIRRFCFTSLRQEPIDIVRGISWLLSLRGPVILAIDQMDNIVAQQLFRFQNAGDQVDEILENDDEARRLKAILQNVAGGLADLVNSVMQRTQVVVSCYSDTWHHLVSETIRSVTDRFQNPLHLSDIPTGQAAQHLIEQRLKISAEQQNFVLPQRWLFASEAFAGASGMSPRELLQRCEQHRRHCLKLGRVTLLTSFDSAEETEDPPHDPPTTFGLDEEFKKLKQSADITPYKNKDTDDSVWSELLESALSGLAYEYEIPPNIDLLVDGRLVGGKSYQYLHARLKIIDHQRQGQEKQYCFRILLHDNAIAFQNRLKAATTEAGIDNKLDFRFLTIVRNSAPPSGVKTQRQVSKFEESGGRWSKISDNEIRTLHAIRQLLTSRHPGAYDWIQQKRLVSNIGFIKASGLLEAIQTTQGNTPTPTDSNRTETKIGVMKRSGFPETPHTIQVEKQPPSNSICFGWREKQGTSTDELVHIPWVDLARHTLIVAGSGSGKTNLLKRIIEESAIAGVPSIVVDCNNDLIGLGEKRPPKEFPQQWTDEDREKERRYTDSREVVTWTPNRKNGNPVALRLLPDFKALADDQDALDALTNVTVNNLEKVVAPGNSSKAKRMKGVLSQVVKLFAQQDGDSIESLVEMLRELPSDISTGITDEVKLAGEMANLLQAKINSTPLWNSGGTVLDPATLFGLESTKTRISILSMIGLPEQDMQQDFLCQLALNLFTWIKQNPAPDGYLRGLLVIDEAKEFVPSGRSSACKETIIRLVAQARKFGLGLLFATQAPKDIDHRIFNNCFTQLFGQVNSPAAVQAVKDLLKQKQASSPESLTRLNKGQFFFHNAEVSERAFRIKTSQCLSHHTSPMTDEQVLKRAKASLKVIASS